MDIIILSMAVYFTLGSIIVAYEEMKDEFIESGKDTTRILVEQKYWNKPKTEEQKERLVKIVTAITVLLTILTWPYFVWVVYFGSDSDNEKE